MATRTYRSFERWKNRRSEERRKPRFGRASAGRVDSVFHLIS